MCSVRQRPIPSAPKLRATFASRGTSALALTVNLAISSAHFIKTLNSPSISGIIVSALPKITLPELPSTVM